MEGARQPSAVSRARIASPCSSPCSSTRVPPGRSRAAARVEMARTTSRPSGPAVERVLGVVQPHLGVARHGAVRDVRRIRHDDVDRAVELGHGVGQVGEDEPQVRRCDVAGVLLGPDERARRVLDGDDGRVRHLGREGEGDRAAAGAEVDGDRLGRGDGHQGVDRELRDELGLGTRHEDSGPDGELERAEGRTPGDVLQRLASGATLDRRRARRECRRCATAASVATRACTCPRLRPSTWPMSSSASTSGVGTRAVVSTATAWSREGRRPCAGSGLVPDGGQLRLFVGLDAGLR